MDSYVRRDPQVSQHTLDGQMAVVLVADIVEIDLFANRKGAHVDIARRCDFWRENQRDSHVQDDT